MNNQAIVYVSRRLHWVETICSTLSIRSGIIIIRVHCFEERLRVGVQQLAFGLFEVSNF